MSYVEHTKIRIISFPVLFKCECCGSYNMGENPFPIQTSYSTRGVFTKSGALDREEAANEILDEKQKVLYSKIVQETNKRKLKNTGYICTCSSCNAVPKWSKFRNKGLDTIYNIVKNIALAISLFLLFPILEGDFSRIYLFLIPIGMFAAVSIPRLVVYAIKSSKIKALSDEYMPTVFEDEEHLEKALTKLGIKEQSLNKY